MAEVTHQDWQLPAFLAKPAPTSSPSTAFSSVYYVDGAIAELRLDVAMVLILGVAGPSISVDALSRGLRRRLRVEMLPTRLADTPLSSQGQG